MKFGKKKCHFIKTKYLCTTVKLTYKNPIVFSFYILAKPGCHCTEDISPENERFKNELYELDEEEFGDPKTDNDEKEYSNTIYATQGLRRPIDVHPRFLNNPDEGITVSHGPLNAKHLI